MEPTSSRLAGRNAGGGGGEIVEVQGGHIVRSTGRKDRHSKVCTAKGPRDRRVRLAAHTAIQFYDVQDRLGYDRPSKAVDWLIKKAKTAIDELAELPAWTPTATPLNNAAKTSSTQQDQISDETDYNIPMENHEIPAAAAAAITLSSEQNRNRNRNQLMEENPNPNGNSSFLPPSLDSDVIADTIKSFFPMCASVETSSSSIQLESYPPDLLSRTSSQNQDLRLSLQSFQEPILMQQQHQNAQNEHHAAAGLFAGNGNQGFYGPFAGWPEHHHHHHPAEINRFQRMLSWNASGAADAGGGFVFNSSPPPLQPLFGQNQLFSTQRGPLQSSNSPSIRAWIDPAIASDHHLHNNTHFPQIHHQQPAMAGIRFSAASLGGFRVPARIHGNEEEHVNGGIHIKPPTSASSNSHH